MSGTARQQKPKVTMQQIADALGLSRNTVSKAFNAHATVPERTRALIFKKAQELGYQSIPPAAKHTAANLALLTRSMPNQSHYGSGFISAFSHAMSAAGYTLAIYIVSGEDAAALRLPPNLSAQNIAGILAIELFDRGYCDFLSALGVPVLFSDIYARADYTSLAADVIMMENRASACTLTTGLVQRGAKSVGFVGDKAHCNSFYERWCGYRQALNRAKLTMNPEACVLAADNSAAYGSSTWMAGQLRAMPALPDAFVCANDYIAISLIKALHKLGVNVPREVQVTGFDDSPEAKVIEPALTTVRIPSEGMGAIGAEMLLSRIRNPELPYRSTCVQTCIKWRESSGAAGL